MKRILVIAVSLFRLAPTDEGTGDFTLWGTTDQPVFADLSERFAEFIGDAPLVIHNAPFDVGFLNAELARVNGPIIGMERVVDTLMLARRKHPAGPNSLDALCKRYQIDRSERTKHSALLDCKLLIEVYLHLIGGHQARLELVGKGHAETRRTGRRRSKVAVRPRVLPSRLSEAEIAAHDAFVKTLKDPIWVELKDD